MKKCMPGVICIENMTMIIIVFIILAIGFYLMRHQPQHYHHQYPNEVIIRERERENTRVIENQPNIMVRPNYGYNNLPQDVLMNPYVPPLRDERYLVPINVSTNVGAVDTNYRQVGMLTPIHHHNKNNENQHKVNILALMGRPLFVSRDTWQYYTMSDQKNSIKLPIIRNGKSGTSEYGIDRLFGGDHVFVEGYNQPFKVTIYDNKSIQYLPVM